MAKKRSKKRQQGGLRDASSMHSEKEHRDNTSRARSRSGPSLRAERSFYLGRNLRRSREVLSRCSSQTHSPHKSFRRTYREDYVRELEVPGYGEHIVETFRTIFRNPKLFWPLLLLAVVLELLVVGATDETVAVFTVLIFLMVWLTTIFLVRQRKAGREVTFRDGLYNAMTPLVSSLIIFAIMVIECIPILLVVIAYGAAMKTDFLTMPSYALMFWGFAGLMMLLSGYLLSSSLIAFIAVSAPGLYPWKAMATATELMRGRRIRFVLRLIVLFVVLAVLGAVVILPLMALRAPVWLMTGVVVAIGGFGSIFMTIYLYLYYRYLLDA